MYDGTARPKWYFTNVFLYLIWFKLIIIFIILCVEDYYVVFLDLLFVKIDLTEFVFLFYEGQYVSHMKDEEVVSF